VKELRAILRGSFSIDSRILAPVVVCTGYVAARVWSFAHVFGRKPPLQPDSIDYLRGASLSIFDPLFWTYSKPWGLPLLYKVVLGPSHVATIVQFSVATVAWMVLALTVARVLRHPVLKPVGLCAILAFALTPLVTEWDGQLLTESLSNSLTAVLVAASIVFVRAPNRLRLLLVVLAAFAAAMTRDTNGYFELLVLVPIGIAVARSGLRRLGLVLAAAVLLIFVLEVWSYDQRRWHGPMQDVIAERVLPVPSALRYFRTRGMPVRPGLGPALIANRAPPSSFDAAPELAYFRPWFNGHARQTYLGYLFTHPAVSLGKPLRGLDVLLAPTRPPPYGLDYFRPRGYRDPLPHVLIRALYPQQGWAVLGAIVAVLALAAALWKAKLGEAAWLVPSFVLLAAIPLAVIVYNGDAIGTGRHELVVGLTARLGVIVLGLLMLDSIASARRAERNSGAETSSSGLQRNPS
jgi:hypothetical protein